MTNRIVLLFACLAALSFFSCQQDEPVLPEEYEQYGTPFAGVPAIEDVVMYEVNLRALNPQPNFQGLISRLDSIKSLGVNVIWLMPIHPIGTINSVNSPYSVKNYKEVNPEFGTLEDLRTLSNEAHARGMAVIMDWVANHTAWDNPWMEHPTWYTRNSDGEVIHPAGTNWLDVADLNYSNDTMRLAMIDAMKYWLFTANVDGFRCDYADGVPFSFWSQAWTEIHALEGRNFILFAEGSRTDHFTAGFDLNFGWNFYGALKNVYAGQSVSKIFTAQTTDYQSIPAGKQWLRFTTNHDESAWDATPMTLFDGEAGALAASVVTIFLGGVPLIYGSQEVGTTSTVPFFSTSTINWNGHPEMLSAYKQMLGFYSQSQAARTGANTVYEDEDIAAFMKVLAGDSVLIITNLRDAEKTWNVPAGLQATTWTNPSNASVLTLDENLSLSAYQYVILD
ncbi:MAG: alpha-amylase [Bacteroidales bacterium]|nr:alpha-amylase [Bacteroidales bacterium]